MMNYLLEKTLGLFLVTTDILRLNMVIKDTISDSSLQLYVCHSYDSLTNCGHETLGPRTF